jgi:hypothetical protein
MAGWPLDWCEMLALFGPFCKKSDRGTGIAGCHKAENFRQLMLQLMLHGAYSIFCLISRV